MEVFKLSGPFVAVLSIKCCGVTADNTEARHDLKVAKSRKVFPKLCII